MIAVCVNAFVFGFVSITITLAGDLVLPEPSRQVCPWARIATAFCIGFGFIAAMFMVAAGCGILSRRIVWIVQGIVTIASVIRLSALCRTPGTWKRSMTALLTGSGFATRLSLVAIGLTLVTTFLSALAPPSSMDALVYHLRVPAVYLLHGNWAPLRDVVQSFQPAYVEMGFGHAMALHTDVVAALLHWAMGVVAAVAAGGWARRLGANPWFAVLLIVPTPLFVWESTGAFIDLGVAAFGSLSIYWASRTDGRRSTTIIAGIFAGLAAGSKLTGAALAVLAGAAALATCWPDWRIGIRRLLGIGIVALVITLPWYVHNFVLTGNPFYPVGNALLGIVERPLATDHYGYGRSLLDLIRSPFDLLWRGSPFDQGWSVGPAFLALVPLGAFVSRRIPVSRVLLGCLIAFWIFWFYSMPQTRLLLPIFPLAAALAAAGMSSALTAGSPRILRSAALGTAGVAAVCGVALGVAFARTYAPAAFGLEGRDAFLTRMTWHYPAFLAVNSTVPATARVAVSGANNLYYLRRESSMVDPNASRAELRGAGFDYLLAVASCGTMPPERPLLWSGRYALPASRLSGGISMTLCASIERL